MDRVPIEIIAEMQAQIDELQGRLLALLNNMDDMATALFDIATTIEYLIDDTTRNNQAKVRLLDRVAVAIELVEDVMGARNE